MSVPRIEANQRVLMVASTVVFLLASYWYLQNIGVLPGPNENPNPGPNDIPPKRTPLPGGIQPAPGPQPWDWPGDNGKEWDPKNPPSPR